MIEERIKHCETLLEEGLFVDALAASMDSYKRLLFDRNEFMPALRDRIGQLKNRASEECSKDPAATREKLVRLIKSTDSFPIFDACIGALLEFEEYSTLMSCRDMDVNLSQDGFKNGHANYIDTLLLFASRGAGSQELGKGAMFGSEVSLTISFNEFLMYNRISEDKGLPMFRARKRFQLDTKVFAAGYDPVRDRYVLTLKQKDRVIGVNAKTLETERVINSPEPGVRGLGIHAGARRGFFNAEFANVMFSFDLDSFEIRKVIEGFALRPERIYLDPDTNTLVTGNLGLSWGNEFYEIAPKVAWRENNLQGRTLTIVDTDTEEVTGTLPAGLRPTAAGISGKHIIAGNFGDNTVHIYDRCALEKADVVAMPPPTSIDVEFELYDKPTGETIKHKKRLNSRMVEGTAILDGRGWVLVACFDVCVLAVIDIGTGAVTDYIPVLDQPFDVVADPGERYAYVSCHVGNVVSIIDLDLKREVGRIQVGPAPVDLTLAGDTLLVPDAQGLTVVDLGEAKKAMGL